MGIEDGGRGRGSERGSERGRQRMWCGMISDSPLHNSFQQLSLPFPYLMYILVCALDIVIALYYVFVSHCLYMS